LWLQPEVGYASAMRPLLGFILILVLSGCAGASKGFDRGALRREIQIGERAQVSDAEIAAALARQPQLPPRFRVGVYVRDPEKHWGMDWQWTADDKDRLLRAVTQLVPEGILGDAFFVNPLTLQGNDLRALRLAAAQHGADALLVVAGASDLDTYMNNWAVTYWLILPALFVPGSTSDALFVARAAMWDVRNEFLYLTAEAESTGSQRRPAAFTDRRGLIDATRRESVDLLAAEIFQAASRDPGYRAQSGCAYARPMKLFTAAARYAVPVSPRGISLAGLDHLQFLCTVDVSRAERNPSSGQQSLSDKPPCRLAATPLSPPSLLIWSRCGGPTAAVSE
jgi:hypothetical protein